MEEQKGEEKKPIGRPSVMTQEVRDAVCLAIAEGQTIRQIASRDDMPAASTIYLALANDENFSDQYARAREAQLVRWEDEILEICDDGTNDWIERENKDGGTQLAANSDHIQRSRLRVDTRKWIMSKRLPKRYGDRKQHEHSGPDGSPIPYQRIEQKIIDPAEE